MVGELDIDWLAPEDGCDGGIIAHHGVSSFFGVHFYESLGR